MCEWGTNEEIELTIIKELSYTGKERMKIVKVDACITSIIKALNEGGVTTTYSCCGHGEKAGVIILKDGRYLVIKNYHGEFER